MNIKRLIYLGTALILFTLLGCSEDNSTGHGTPQETIINITNISPTSPATLKFYQTDPNDRTSITYNYSIVETGGARIWIQPFALSANDGTASILYSPSGVYTGSGSKTVVVSAESSANDPVHITQLEILIKNPSQTDTNSQSFMNVDYTFTI